ncbi:MAG: S8 family serine peptidase [Deltaproteobacteria bacterium]|nr:S8 family serine peptidase [Deltaproteobacteria bacterium]
MSKVNKVTKTLFLAFFIISALFFYTPDVSAQGEFVAGELIIKLKEGVNTLGLRSGMAQKGMPIVESIPELGFHVIQIPPEELEDMQRSLSRDPDFEYVEKNYIVHANVIPNDQFFNFQTYLNVINAPMAWDSEIGDPNTVIAVLDSGVDATHEDLSGKVLQGCSTLGNFSETSCGANTNNIAGHGSGVSGTATAITNNFDGVAGVCWNCSILPVKVLDDTGSGTSVDIVQGILFAKNYALNNPTKKVIINMSFGRDCNGSGISQFEQDAINLAWNSGLLVIAAAGNEGNSNVHCPASAANTIAVSATDDNDNLANFSSFGNFVDLAAPGVSIANVFPGDNYVFWSGTSFSSPIVAGLVWSANTALTNAEVDQILRDTADNIGSSFFFGDGRVNA